MLSTPRFTKPSASQFKDAVQCSVCAVRDLCLPGDLSDLDFSRLGAMIHTSRKVAKGEALYRAGDEFLNIYAIKTGAFKTVLTMADGREQVTGFQIAGEALGLEGLHTGRHTFDAIALEPSVLCVLPFSQLEQLCNESAPMRRHVYRLMSGEIVRESRLAIMLGSMRAEERVSAFLLTLARRLRARRYPDTEFKLRMSRKELGSYLGIKLETVSRVLSKFQREKLIQVRGKMIRILDAAGLQRV
jgi:CRP/FNR family transcriptional regulator